MLRPGDVVGESNRGALFVDLCVSASDETPGGWTRGGDRIILLERVSICVDLVAGLVQVRLDRAERWIPSTALWVVKASDERV